MRSDPAPTQVLTSTDMPGAGWFPGERLDYVDRVFRDRDADSMSIVAVTESGDSVELSWGELEGQVAA